MKVKEFFDWVDKNRHLFDDCAEKDVEVQLLIGSVFLTDSLELIRPVYKFSPFLEKPKGTLVIEVKEKSKN